MSGANKRNVYKVAMEADDLVELFKKRIRYVGYTSSKGKPRKIPIDLDAFMNVILGGAMPNISSKFLNINSDEEGAKVILKYLMSHDISSSHMPTLLKIKEAPNYHFGDYEFLSEENKIDVLNHILSFYYVNLWSTKRRAIVAINSESEAIRTIINDNFRVVGGDFYFELKKGRIEANVGGNMHAYFIPMSPSATYFTILILLSAIFQVMEIEEKHPLESNLEIEFLLLKNSGGNKWSVVYHPAVNLYRFYQMFFTSDDAFTSKGGIRFVEFLRSLLPPHLNKQNIADSYYSDLASFSFSLLIEGYLNVEKISNIISEKISLEFRAQRENKVYRFGPILFTDYVQQKMLGGDKMDKKFKNLRKRMQKIGFEIGALASKGDTQKSLLKRIIMGIKSEDIPSGFTSALLDYLPRLEREEIRITVPSELSTLPIQEFLVIKNEFVSILWNKYIGGEIQ